MSPEQHHHDSHEPLKTSILAYQKEHLVTTANYLKIPELSQLLALSAGNFRNLEKINSELVFAVFGPNDPFDAFIQDIASLKLVSKVPALIAIILEGAAETIQEFKSEIAADEFIYLPLASEALIKIIKTYLVSIRISHTKSARHDHRKTQALGSILVESEIISPVQLKKALDYQRKTTNIRLGEALVALGYIDNYQKTHFLASQMGVAMATPKQYASADFNVVALIPERMAREYHCVALEKHDRALTVAMLDVMNLRLLDSLRDITELQIHPILGTLDEIQVSLDRYYGDIASHRSASELMSDLGQDIQFLKTTPDEINVEEAVSAGAELGIIKLVNLLISNAVRDRASDIHIEPMEKELIVRYRIDGELRRVMSPPKHTHQALITRVKILSDLNIAERRLPQDGRMAVRMGIQEIDIRVSILPTIFGEKAVLRILDKESFQKNMESLGFTPHELDIFHTNISKPYGMVVVTGPTGSGKSTTLYSALQSIKSVSENIITVEDPVEFHMENITQVQVNSAIGMTFASALRSILRQDPDTILIGEIRDAETADIAVKMALTGHTVFSTLHTNDAASAVTRFVDIGIPPLLLASSLNLVVAQRLVRRICARCKNEYAPTEELLVQLHLPLDGNQKFYRGEGCVACHGTGYSGRIGIFEMLEISKTIRQLILRNASSIDIAAQAEKEGMKNLRHSSIELVLKGEITIEQALAATIEL